MARHVIISHIQKAQQIETEEFDYRLALPGIVQMQLHSHYWIANTESFNTKTAPTRLAAFLDQYASPEKKITDLSNLMEKIEQIAPSIKDTKHRSPMTLLYVAYNTIINKSTKSDKSNYFENLFKEDFSTPSIELLATITTLGINSEIDAEAYDPIYSEYISNRHHKNTIPLSLKIIAAIQLRLAEAHRRAGNAEKTNSYISAAVETIPGSAPLLDIESKLPWPMSQELPWFDISFQ